MRLALYQITRWLLIIIMLPVLVPLALVLSFSKFYYQLKLYSPLEAEKLKISMLLTLGLGLMVILAVLAQA